MVMMIVMILYLLWYKKKQIRGLNELGEIYSFGVSS